MISVTADPAIQNWLSNVTEAAEIRDADGNLLGFFKPRSQIETEAYERAKALFDPAETERVLAAERGKGRPLAEFLRELEARETSG